MPDFNDAPLQDIYDLNPAGPQGGERGAMRAKRGRCVRTQEIKRVLKGREAEAVRGLGVPWHGRDHINCPYPDHPDRNPSWRLMDDGNAVCTCRNVHSVFDVVIAKEGGDFESAKIRIAEALGRTDLIVDPEEPTAHGITVDGVAELKGLDPAKLRIWGWRDLGNRGKYHDKPPSVGITYRHRDGSGELLRIRTGDQNPKNKFRWRKGDRDAPLYGAWFVDSMPPSFVLLVEGESDCATLWTHGFQALGLPGAGNWNEAHHTSLLERFETIYVFVEPDNGGRNVLKWLARSSIRARARLIYMLPETKDVSALYLKDRPTFVDALRALKDGAIPWDEEKHGAIPQTSLPTVRDGKFIGKVIIEPKAPYANAQAFVAARFTSAGLSTLRRHRGAYYAWRDGAYHDKADDGIRAQFYSDLSKLYRMTDEGPEQIDPDKRMVDDHMDALRSVAHLDEAIEAAAWISGGMPDMPADEMLSMRNGLLHLPTRRVIPHTPDLFTYNALPFDYDANVAQPAQWLEFLDSLWPQDKQSIATLQDIFGLCLTRNTEFQKIFLILGPPRSGKGTIARTLRALLGSPNVVSPSLGSLAGEFGLEQLIGKLVAIVSDAHMSGKIDPDTVVERLLNISGEDAVAVNRKNRTFWNGQLLVRVIMLANGLPRFNDPSGAFANRFVILRILPSFLGQEDLTLGKRLMKELPGILNWSIAGWEKLKERGFFIQPNSGLADIKQMREMVSPIGVFVRELCDVGVGFQVLKAELYNAWKGWCIGQGREPGSISTFSRMLKEVLPSLGESRPWQEGPRPEYYTGINLKPAA